MILTPSILALATEEVPLGFTGEYVCPVCSEPITWRSDFALDIRLHTSVTDAHVEFLRTVQRTIAKHNKEIHP